MSDDSLDPRPAERLARAAHAAHELSELLWDALRQELADPRPQRVIDLSRQLSAIACTLGTFVRAETSLPGSAHPQPGAPARAGGPSTPAAAPPTAPPRSATVLVDELAVPQDTEVHVARARRSLAPADDPL